MRTVVIANGDGIPFLLSGKGKLSLNCHSPFSEHRSERRSSWEIAVGQRHKNRCRCPLATCPGSDQDCYAFAEKIAFEHRVVGMWHVRFYTPASPGISSESVQERDGPESIGSALLNSNSPLSRKAFVVKVQKPSSPSARDTTTKG